MPPTSNVPFAPVRLSTVTFEPTVGLEVLCVFLVEDALVGLQVADHVVGAVDPAQPVGVDELGDADETGMSVPDGTTFAATKLVGATAATPGTASIFCTRPGSSDATPPPPTELDTNSCAFRSVDSTSLMLF